MQNLHDDNSLDNLSRKAAEQFEPDQGTHSWQKLEPRLDAELPQKKEKKRRFLIIIILLALLIGGGVVFSGILNSSKQTTSIDNADKSQDKNAPTGDQGQTKEQTTKEKTTNAGSTTKSTNKTAATGTTTPNETASTESVGQTDKQTDNLISKQFSGQRKSTPQENISRPQTSVTSASNNRRNNTRNNTPVQRNPKPGVIVGTTDFNDQSNAITGQKKTGLTNNTVTDPTSNAVTEDKMDPESRQITGTIKNSDRPINTKLKPPPTDYPTNYTSLLRDPVKQNNKPRNRWEFGLTYAPDISTVKFTHTQPPGHNLGITIGYNFSKRLSLQTGFIYTIKNYKMDGSDYHPPKGYWTNYVKLETVSGECTMWDIPLNLRYNIAPRKKSNFFVSSGLSSYLMQKEDYDFFYYYNGNPVNRYRSMDTTRRHWMSVLNISAGYERQIGKTLSLQVEPFFKQPLTGVGFGDMKLNSTGVYFTLKYKPLSGRLSP